MNWGIEDFAAAAAIFMATAIALVVALRLFRRQPARLIAAGAVVLVALAVWAHLAVGIWH
jgi:hypothetical protein